MIWCIVENVFCFNTKHIYIVTFIKQIFSMSSSQIHSPNSVRGRGSDGDTRVSSACTPGGGGTSGDCSQDVKLRNDTNNAMQCSLEPIQTGWRHHHCCDKHDRLLTLHSVWEVTWARKVTNKIHRLLSQENCRRINWSPPPSDAATDPGPSFPLVVAAVAAAGVILR